MLTLGQSAAALEQHIEQTGKEQREKDSEAFARRVSLLIDSMHSAAIDVGKILSDEIDDKAWDAYLKGNRGVFTSRAVRLLGGSETRAIRAHYESDPEFQRSVNRYVHDFEAMLRRVLAERDGGMIAVTLMSSDMGKLYAALAQAIDKRPLDASVVEVEVVGRDPAERPVGVIKREQQRADDRRLQQVALEIEPVRRAVGLAGHLGRPRLLVGPHAERQQDERADGEEQEIDRDDRRELHR